MSNDERARQHQAIDSANGALLKLEREKISRLQKSLATEACRRQQLERELAEALKLVGTDPLTGLNNRRGMGDRMSPWLASATRARGKNRFPKLSTMVIDIDHFKRVNDTHGHAAGDTALRHLADILREQFRGTDIVCRFGGEEFVVLLPDTPLEVAVSAAKRFRRSVEASIVKISDSLEITMTVSIGVASGTPEDISDVEKAIETADSALYKAKEWGRNRVVEIVDVKK